MTIYNFIKDNGLEDMDQISKAKYLCYYAYKEYEMRVFKISNVQRLFVEAGFNSPNSTRLKDGLTKGKNKFLKADLTIIPAKIQELEILLSQQWDDYETIESESELLDESKFCNIRDFLTKIIKQINCSYKSNCYDCCAVMLRRLLEICLILAYKNIGIDNEIKNDNGNYFMLEGIIKNAKTNKKLDLSRIKERLDDFREVGNFSAHGITYTASKKDIDDIKINYRAILEELYNKAGLKT